MSPSNDDVLIKLLIARKEGKVSDEMIDIFINDPHKVLRQYPVACEHAEQIALLPKDVHAEAFLLHGGDAFYVVAGTGVCTLYRGNKPIAHHAGIGRHLWFADGLLMYVFYEQYPQWHLQWGGYDRGVIWDERSFPPVRVESGWPLYTRSVMGKYSVMYADAVIAQENRSISEVVRIPDGRWCYVVSDPEQGKQEVVVLDVSGKATRYGPFTNVERVHLFRDGTPCVVERHKTYARILRGMNEIGRLRSVETLIKSSMTGEVVCIGSIMDEEDGCIAYVGRERDGVELPAYRWFHSASLIDDVLLAVGQRQDGGECVAWQGADEESFSCIQHGSLSLANGRPLYIATREHKSFVIWDRHEGGLYDEIFSLHVEGDTIVYGARKGRKIFRVERPMTASV